MMKKDSRLVWTSDPEVAKKLRDAGLTAPVPDKLPQQQTIRVEIDRKKRKGKSVTVASGFELAPESLSKLAASLKKRCGSGGTVHESDVEIQGEHLDTVATELEKLGYKVKRIGR